LCRKCEEANVKWCGFDTCLDIGIESTIIGFYNLLDHNTKNGFFFGLIKNNSCKGADSGKRKIKNTS
jgi:hypothetical protein